MHENDFMLFIWGGSMTRSWNRMFDKLKLLPTRFSPGLPFSCLTYLIIAHSSPRAQIEYKRIQHSSIRNLYCAFALVAIYPLESFERTLQHSDYIFALRVDRNPQNMAFSVKAENDLWTLRSIANGMIPRVIYNHSIEKALVLEPRSPL